MDLGKVPPQDIEAEQAVIGSMLTDQDAVSSAIETLKPEDFYREDNKIIYKAPTNVVQRVVTSNKEYVKFNFSKMKELKNVNTCNISLAVIDGMGEEYKNEFNMKDSYQKATDIQTKDSLTIEDNLIRDVKIENGIAQIQLDL